MNITIKRIALAATYTIGNLYIDGQYFCDTLEDKVRPFGEPKVYGKTAIPYGTYEVKWTYSPRFKRYMPLIDSVPGFSGIRIHAGNTEADTEGCILVGYNKQVGKVLNSKDTVSKLYPIIQKACKEGKVTIEIK